MNQTTLHQFFKIQSEHDVWFEQWEKYNEEILDPMRNLMYEHAPRLQLLGLPERTGFTCWQRKDFIKSISKLTRPEDIQFLIEEAQLHLKFDINYDRSFGYTRTDEEWVPHKTNSCAFANLKMLNYLKKKMEAIKREQAKN